VGFHGDRHLLALVNELLAHCSQFIETGANVGSTLVYVASRHPDIRCLSCEPDPIGFRRASENAAPYPNATVLPLTSGDFFAHIEEKDPNLFSHRTLFWLDAHGHGFRWPLQEEVAFVTKRFKSAFLLIDDFEVPGMNVFGYDVYEDQVCSFAAIKDAIHPGLPYRLYYPDYTERTSSHHPLRGWGLIAYGEIEEMPFEKPMRGIVRRADP
jgi:hypothetical protein